MRLNRKELKKIDYDFRILANRLFKTDFNEYNKVLTMLIRFVSDTEIIHDYIMDCGKCDQDMKKEFEEVRTGRAIFDLGNTDAEEVRNIHAILCYIVKNNIHVHSSIGFSYSRSTKFQEIISDFNDRVVMIFVQHIESYLTKVGIDMGLDENNIYNITVNGGQVNIANDNACIAANNTANSIDAMKLEELIKDVVKSAKASNISMEERETLLSNLDVISQECKSDKPRKSFIKTAISGIKVIKGTMEFGAAIATLVQFLQPFICS